MCVKSIYGLQGGLAILALAGAVMAQEREGTSMEAARWSFQGAHGDQANYPRPRDGAAYDLSPPGFCWWRVIDQEGTPAAVEEARYRLKITAFSGERVYDSGLLDITAHVPDRALPPGRYTWTVDAVTADGGVIDRWPTWSFKIREGAVEQPWVPAGELLARVPREHPRCIFLKRDLAAIRTTLATTRKEAFESLSRAARKALTCELPVEPTYGQRVDTDPRGARMVYHPEVAKITRLLESNMNPLALYYLLTGDRRMGEKAKAMLLEVVSWDPSGVTSWYQKGGHGPALRIFRVQAQTYDWIHDLLTETERDRVKQNILYRGNEMLSALRGKDFYYRSGSSHHGRIICYLGEYAVAVAEEPEAEAWLDYSNRGVMTAFPHWAGPDGGWNEGMSYGLAYNGLHTPPLTTVSRATGYDLWLHPYFSQARHFFMYCTNLRGEIKPFGDGEQGKIGSGAGIAGLLFFHANRYQDPAAKWYLRQFRGNDGTPPEVTWRPAIFVEDTVEPRKPDDLVQDRLFSGVGWVAMHSNLADPDQDLHLMFKSSPYGSVSHSYADQNTFAIMKGGKALAMPSGHYWPTYGAPFHAEYTRHTVAKNGILVAGEGQIVRRRGARGSIVDFASMRRIGYACGDATPAYGGRLTRCRRHVVMLRPSVIVVVDDLAAPEAVAFQWLFHTREELERVDEGAQSFFSTRDGESMHIRLFTPGGFGFQLTDDWPVDPTKGYEDKMEERGGRIPPKHWHFTADTRQRSGARRIAAVMTVAADGVMPAAQIEQRESVLEVDVGLPGGSVQLMIDLSTDQVGESPILEVVSQGDAGPPETLSVK